MRAAQATLVLASLLRSHRRFQSFDLGKIARERVFALQKLLEDFEEIATLADCPQALAKLDAAYHLLSAEPPLASPEDIPNRVHPVLAAVDRADMAAELAAWQALLREGAP